MTASRLALTLLALVSVTSCKDPSMLSAESPKPKTFGPSQEAIDGRRWLADTARVGQRAGAGELQLIAVGPGTPGDHVPGLVNVPEDRCALLYARGSESIDDIDLFVYGDDGAQFGSDEAPDDLPTLLVCPGEARRLYVTARVAQGNGIVAVGVQEVAPSSAETVARAVGARNYGTTSESTPEAWPGFGEAVALHRESIGGNWQDVRRVALPVDSRVGTRISARVGEDRCIDALALPSDEVAHLELAAADSEGRIFARAEASGRERSLIICSSEDQNITLELRPHAGRGVAVLAISTTQPGGGADIEPESPRFDLIPSEAPNTTRRRVTERLDSAKLARVGPALEGKASVGSRSSLQLGVSPGCTRLDIWSDGALIGIEGLVWGKDGTLAARGRGMSHTPLFLCTRDRQVRLDVEATRRKGPFTVELRPDVEAPPELVRHPLAAGRLLDRMHAAGLLDAPHDVGKVTAVELGPEHVERFPLLVPMQRCVEVHLGLGSGAHGAEVRLIDSKTGLEIELSRGAHSAGARACAFERNESLHVIAELRALSGEATGLFATRLLTPGGVAD